MGRSRVKSEAGKLTARDRSRRLELEAAGNPSRSLSLGGRVATGPLSSSWR